MNNDRLKAIAIEQGGKFHGPNVEHLSIPETKYFELARAIINAVNAEENTPTLPADVVAYIKQLEDALKKLNNHWGVKESHKFTPHEHDLNINAHRARSYRPAILDGL